MFGGSVLGIAVYPEIDEEKGLYFACPLCFVICSREFYYKGQAGDSVD